MPQRLQLFTSYLSRSNILILKVFLGLTKTDEVANWEYTDNPEAASAFLIDADSEAGSLQLKDLACKNKHQVLIAFSSRIEGFPEDVLVLPRPLRSAELIPILREAGKQFLDFSREQEQRSSQIYQSDFFDKKTDIAGAPVKIRRVLEVLHSSQDKVLKVIDRPTRPVVFDIKHRRYYTANLSQVEVEDLLASPAGNVKIEELSPNRLVSEIQDLEAQDIDIPLWTAALAVSNGRLFDSLSPTEFYRLNRWPDLKKLGQDPLHLKLTALLRRGGTISYFADFFKAPVEDVVDFINACWVLNYLEHQRKLDVLAEASEQKPSNASKRSLFSKIRSRLGI